MHDQLTPPWHLLARKPDDRPPLFSTSDTTRSLAQLRGAVRTLTDAVQIAPGSRWLLFTEDADRFLQGFLAVLHAGGTAVLPPNANDEVLRAISSGADGALTDSSVPSIPDLDPSRHASIPARVPDAEPASPESFSSLDPDRPCLELFTSGTTGSRNTIRKNLRHLYQDLSAEQEVWSDQLEQTTFFGTISHQHIYGLLMRVITPACAGHTIHPHPVPFPGDLREAVQSASGEAALVTSPSHLKSLTRSEVLSTLSGTLTSVFSGGGVISEEITNRVQNQLGIVPYDVFGTTETGGIAWRPANEDRWRTFPRVETRLDEDDRLLVRSPAVSVSDDWYATGDLAEKQNGSFRLKGRADRVVNIAESRLSLPDLEAWLREHDEVSDAAASVRAPDVPDRDRRHVFAAVVPEQGDDTETDQASLRNKLRSHCLERFESVCVPKFWLFPDELPTDQLGKVQFDDLKDRL